LLAAATAPGAGRPFCTDAEGNATTAGCGREAAADSRRFSATGCQVYSIEGSGMAGIFTLGESDCTVTLTLFPAQQSPAPHGWSCQAHDRAHPSLVLGGESRSTSTTASIPIPATVAAEDTISFACTPF
jgi:hypothetical protein